MSKFRWFVAIFLVSLAVRSAIILIRKSYLEPETSEVVLVAMSLAERGEFGNAYSGGSGPTAHVAPLYPFALSWAFKVLGDGDRGRLAQELLSAAAASVQFGLLPAVAAANGLAPGAGILAGLVGALVPVSFWAENKGSFETTFSALFLVLISWDAGRIWNSGSWTAAAAARSGLAWGAALLTQPTLLAPIAAFVAAILWRSRLRFLPSAGLAICLAALCLLPWWIRNYREFGVWMPALRSNFGLELSIAYSDYSAPDFQTNMDSGLFADRHPRSGAKGWAEIFRLGEVEFNRQRRDEALAWIRRNPRRAAKLVAQHVALFWFPELRRVSQNWIYQAISLAGILGGLVLVYRGYAAATPLFCVLAAYPLIYYIVQSMSRYRYPIDWILLLLAASLVVRIDRPAEVPTLQ